MNNFNNVFLCVKRHCCEKGAMEGAGIFEKLAQETNIPMPKLEFILNTLQNLELLKYSTEGAYIKLTSFGKRQQRLFTDT